jgi:outer membrane protein OmpA-like peptidoglycan-associated protein
MSKLAIAFCLCAVLAVPVLAQQDTNQDTNQTHVQLTPMPSAPVYHVIVVARSIEAVNYRQRSGKTKIDFRGTALLPDAGGDASVEAKRDKVNIDAKFKHLEKPTSFGPEYLTYVLWAITPQGRPMNLGEVVPGKDGKGSLTVTTPLQAFGLVLTAEPYFAVTRPSDMVVANNVVRRKIKGIPEPVNAKFAALQRGAYTVSIPASQLPSMSKTQKVPLQLLEARNAVAIAEASGAQNYAADTLTKARDLLNQAEDGHEKGKNSKVIASVARGATQDAEDARLLTIQRRDEQEVARQQQAAEQARQRAQVASQQAQVAGAAVALQAMQRQQAEQAAEQARGERAQAEAARQAALQQQQQLQLQMQQAQLTAQQAEQQKEQLRNQLQQQLNQVFQTRETARGLIVDMPDVLFGFDQATLKPEARIRLAKVAGIVLAHPDLHLQLEGFTDNIGSDQYNEQLSQRRADAVRDFLTSQGVSPNNIGAEGFGKSDPVASNSTSEGRAQNRRVDMVVSGTAIGSAAIPAPPGGNASTPAGAGAGTATTPTGGTTGSAAGAESTTTPGASAPGTVAAPTAPTTQPPR